MPREFPRHVRIAESIKRELAEPVTRAGREAGLGLLTITQVLVASDLSLARVLVSTLGQAPSRAALDLLRDRRPEMRTLIARALRLKKLPALVFELDDSIAAAARISDLLHDRRPLNDGE